MPNQYGQPAPAFLPPTGLPQAAPQYSNVPAVQTAPLSVMPQPAYQPAPTQPMHPAVQMQQQAAQVNAQTALNPIPQIDAQTALNALPPVAQALAQPPQPQLMATPTGAIPSQGVPMGANPAPVPNLAPQALNPAPQPVMVQPNYAPQPGQAPGFPPQAGQPLGAAPPAMPPSTTLTMANPGDTSTLTMSMFPQQTS